MASEKLNSGAMGVLDDQTAPTILVSGIRGVMQHDGIVTINFTNPVAMAPGSEKSGAYDHVVARLAMPVPAFMRITKFFLDHQNQLFEDGVIKIDEKNEEPIEGDSGST